MLQMRSKMRAYILFVLITVRQNQLKYTKNPQRVLFCTTEMFRKAQNNKTRTQGWRKLLLRGNELAAGTEHARERHAVVPCPV